MNIVYACCPPVGLYWHCEYKTNNRPFPVLTTDRSYDMILLLDKSNRSRCE